MSVRNIWKAYLHWLNFRKPGPGTPLLGNPMNIRGQAPGHERKKPPFTRAEFGKYERRRERARKMRFLLSFLFGLFVLWVIYKSIMGLALFLSD